ncbi:MAG: hypothetical protein IKS45_03080, partial [Thermoguttaceae bacterium]|nr:hypothetical protein [Thermoguttaceae bacterium]
MKAFSYENAFLFLVVPLAIGLNWRYNIIVKIGGRNRLFFERILEIGMANIHIAPDTHQKLQM